VPDPTVPPVLPIWQQREWQARGATLTIAVDAPAKAQHGRFERRILWALADPAQNGRIGDTGTVGQPWPHVQQLYRVERRRIRQTTGETETEVTVGIASLPADQANAADLLAFARGHWGIENKTHYVRDVTFDEDRCQIRSGAAPQVFAACRNLAIALLRRWHCPNIAAALRTNAGRPYLAIHLVLARGQP
jgi:predicted transposase YbfD/YdcC